MRGHIKDKDGVAYETWQSGKTSHERKNTMKDVVMIDGVRYRKCAYVDECCENLFHKPQGEVVKIIEVRPIYKPRVAICDLRIEMPQMKFRSGDKIRIIKE